MKRPFQKCILLSSPPPPPPPIFNSQVKAKAMFTLYRIVKRSVPETVPGKASVHTRNATFGTISAPEQDYFAPVLKDLIPETQQITCSCSHCTGSVSVTLRFTIRYSVNIAQIYKNVLWHTNSDRTQQNYERYLVEFISIEK